MNRSFLFLCSSVVVISACTSTVKNYSQPQNLLFQQKQNNSQSIQVQRDTKLCGKDTIEQQNCPIQFYIDHFKAGDFYINNQANYELTPGQYTLKVQNCNKECATTEVKYDVKEQALNPNLILSVDANGLPFIIQNQGKPHAQITKAPEVMEINLAADALFKFDRASTQDLLPAGRQQLNDLATKIKTYSIDVDSILLTGHTDRLGGADYNMRLAQNRANTVRDYLVSQGIASNVIQTASQGKTMPVTDGCWSIQERHQLHECLQPDRRVSVKITKSAKN